MRIGTPEVAQCSVVQMVGEFQRHTSTKVVDLGGTRFGGRWGPAGLFSVLYLGRPTDSVIVEAHRHLVEPIEGMTPSMVGPRKLWTCNVSATELLDLRDPANRKLLGLSEADLLSPRDSYERCHEIAIAAHQLELHGVIAPAATGLGETLALFDQHLPPEEFPTVKAVRVWNELPADPRKLRVVSDERTAENRN